MKFFQAVFLAAMLFAASASFAGEADLPPILKVFKAKGGSVDFLGNAHGLDGWLVRNEKGRVQYIYAAPDGSFLEGMLFEPNGTSVTMHQLKAYKQRMNGSQEAVPGADNATTSKPEKFYAELEKSHWIGIGDSKAPYIYIIMNVACDHCQAFWKELEPSVTGGKLQVRLVPFGDIAENRNGGAALLSVENPGEAWRAYVAGDKSALDAVKIKGDAYSSLDANTTFAKKWRFPKVPLTIYRRLSDGVVTTVVGKPDNSMLLLAEFLALGDKKKEDSKEGVKEDKKEGTP